MSPSTILDFWFKELTPKSWFEKNLELDNLIKKRFENIHRQASTGNLVSWREESESALAEIIILDQFSRNIYRNTAQSFAYDSLALKLAQEAVAKNLNNPLSTEKRAFLYMPYMHSESLKIHEEAQALFEEKGLEQTLIFELKHKKIIARFGRYPHRNKILGRISTEEEVQFLKEPSSSF